MSEANDKQYATPKNLEARFALHRRFATGEVDMFRSAWEHYPFAPNQAILEVGCGTGAFWKHPAAAIPDGATLLLTDKSEGMVAKTREVLADGPRATIEVADVMDLPYDDARFDGVIANFVLFAVPDADQALAQIARVLKPGGFLGMTNPGAGHMGQIDEAVGGLPIPAMPTGEELAAQLPAALDSPESIVIGDELVVTELDPLLAWLRSLPAPGDVIEARVRKLAAVAGPLIESQGAFHVDRRTSLTVARKR